MERIAIFGGSFNPVHSEHINLVNIAIEKLNLDKLFVVPTFISPHKENLDASASDRLAMLRLAFMDNEKVEISDFEIQNGGNSYSYITCEHFRKEYPYAEIFFICGGDMLVDFYRWKNPDRILNAVTLASFDREDYFVDYTYQHKYFLEKFNKDFVEIGYKGKKFSSTRIRVYSMLKLPLDNLTDKSVIEYIEKNEVYKSNIYFEYATSVLPTKRLIHTAEVVIKAESKVRELSLSKEKVELSAVLHDVAKYQKVENYPNFTLPKDVPPPVVHSFLGAYIAENVLGIKDEEIIDAIRYHTSGKANMTTLGKLIFVADMVEDTRVYDGVEKLRSYFEESLDKCFIECLKEEMIHLKNKGQPIYGETLNAYNYYIKEI